MDDSNHVAVIDFGSQYTQLIVRRVRELGFFAMLYSLEDFPDIGKPGAIILSGGPKSTSEPDAPDLDFEALKAFDVPVLGVCYGMQLLNLKFGGTIEKSDRREYGSANLFPDIHNPLYEGISEKSQVWMSHSDTVKVIPECAKVIGTNQHGTPVSLQWGERFFGIQFHPEVTHSHEGLRILQNFLGLAKDLEPFKIDDFKREMIERIRETVGDRQVVCGVSGGVDSTVLAVLLKEAGVKVRAIFVDNGLLRKNEAEEVQANFKRMGLEIETIDAAERFLDALAGEADPEKKAQNHRKPVHRCLLGFRWRCRNARPGNPLSRCDRKRVEREIQGLHHQDPPQPCGTDPGTSGGGKSPRATGGAFQRRGARAWPFPRDRAGHPRAPSVPWPGPCRPLPGRIVDRERLDIIRECDAIFIGKLKEHGWYDKVWQAYAGLIPVKTVGVKGDERSYEWATNLRAVISEDAMTAEWVDLPAQLLRETSQKILNEVDGINRVLYDISTKPPASIEWE